MELALCRYEFLYSFVVLASWVSDPFALPLFDDVAGHGPFDIFDGRWYSAVYLFPGSGGFCISFLIARDSNVGRDPDECDLSAAFFYF